MTSKSFLLEQLEQEHQDIQDAVDKKKPVTRNYGKEIHDKFVGWFPLFNKLMKNKE